MRKKYVNSTTGFTFVETLISFSIVGIFLALTWAIVGFVLLKNSEQTQSIRGHFLAVEGMEMVKQIRQTAVNRDRESGFQDSIGRLEGSFVIAENGDEFALTPGSNELIEMDDEPTTVYCRTITMEGDEANEKKITTSVRWGDVNDCAAGDKIISYSTTLADLTH